MKKYILLTGALIGFAATSAHAEPYCREFTKEIKVGNQIQEGYGTACMQPDGSWKVVSDVPRVEYNEPKRVEYVVREQRHYVSPRISFVKFFNDNKRYNKHRSNYRGRHDYHDSRYKKHSSHSHRSGSSYIAFSFF